MEIKYCQSCGMPMNAEGAEYGTNADGTLSEDYCSYCYDKGAFTQNCTLEEMIDICLPVVAEWNKDMKKEEVNSMLHEFMPSLKRWKMA